MSGSGKIGIGIAIGAPIGALAVGLVWLIVALAPSGTIPSGNLDGTWEGYFRESGPFGTKVSVKFLGDTFILTEESEGPMGRGSKTQGTFSLTSGQIVLKPFDSEVITLPFSRAGNVITLKDKQLVRQ